MSQTFVEQIDQVKQKGNFPADVIVQEGEVQVDVNLAQAESIGVLVNKVTVHGKPVLTPSALTDRASKAAAKLEHLFDRFRPIEIDGHQMIALIRSDEPSENDNSIEYYEMMIRSTGETSLVKRQYDKRSRNRTDIPFAATKDQLSQVVHELVAGVST